MHKLGKIGLGLAMMLLGTVLLNMYKNHPLLSPDWHRALHVFGGVIFLGNVIVSAVWIVSAHRSNSVPALLFALNTLSRTDAIFIAPGSLLAVMTGIVLADAWNGLFKAGWILTGFVLLVIAGIAWRGFLVPCQETLRMLIQEDAQKARQQFSPSVRHELWKWYAWGMVAALPPLITLFLMIIKPRATSGFFKVMN